MKYNASETPPRAARRTLSAFSDALLALLETRSFEDISVRELCDRANYPRSTFYNYFDDIYDLLDYCWRAMWAGIAGNRYDDCPPEARLYVLFDDLYTEFEAHREELNRIFRANRAGGKLLESVSGCLRRDLTALISAYPAEIAAPIPDEMLAAHCGSILQLVFEWSFLRGDGLSREAANAALRYLFGALAV